MAVAPIHSHFAACRPARGRSAAAGSAAGRTAASRTCFAAARSRRWRPSARTPSASVERFLSGEGEELHTTILATQRAELSFDLFLQVRNKVVSAYQEIMRMQM